MKQKVTFYFLLMTTFIVCLWTFFFVLLERSLPCWDSSGYLHWGYIVAEAYRRFDLKGLWNIIWQQYYYPPLHSMILGIPMALWAFDLVLLRSLSLLFFGFSVLMMYLIGKRLSSEWGGLLAAFLLLTSPLHIVFATSTMKEMLGLLLTLLCFWYYFRKRWLGAGLLLAALTFFKYNYGGLVAFVLGFEAVLEFITGINWQKIKKQGQIFLPTLALLGPWIFLHDGGLKNFFKILSNPFDYTLYDASFWGHLFFYPQAIAYSYTFSPILGLILGLSFLLSLRLFRQKSIRVLSVFFLINFFLGTRHMGNNQERFIFTTVWAFFQVCSYQLVNFSYRLVEMSARLRAGLKISPHIRGFIIGFGLVLGGLILKDLINLPGMIKPTGAHTMASPIFNEVDFKDTRYDFNRMYWPHQYVLPGTMTKRDILEWTMAALEVSRPVRVIGYVNEFSPGLWEIFFMEERKKRGVERVGGPEQLVTLEVADGGRFDTGDFKKMNRKWRGLIEEIKENPDWRLVKKKEFVDLGLTISIFE